ncbi:MAG: carboxypeptidase regulatory-like domain-containing protein [Planctomycetes bacterium]|nr:carboxypeptidase regulatory-like domain-containing protein [Planctomycetota bacterium]
MNSDHSTPAADIEVEIAPKYELMEMREYEIRSEDFINNLKQNAGRSTRTAKDGKFEFKNLPFGVYSVRAIVNKMVSAEEKIVSLEKRSNLDLKIMLPKDSSFEGKIIAPPGGKFDRLKIGIERWSELQKSSASWPRIEMEAEIDKTGRFRFESIKPDRFVVFLILPTTMVPNSFGGGSKGMDAGEIRLGEVDFTKDGANNVEFTVKSKFPGFLRLAATIDGKPASGLRARLVQKSAAGGIRGWGEGAGGLLDSSGGIFLGPVLPRLSTLYISDMKGSWSYEYPDGLEIPVAGVKELNIKINLFEGVVHLVNKKSGEPLAETPVWIRSAEGFVTGTTTNAKGEIKLTRADGEHLFLHYAKDKQFGMGAEQQVEFTWSVDGPDPSVIKISVEDR